MTSEGITAREARLLRLLVDARRQEPEVTARRWRDTADDGYADGPEALAADRSFASGRSCG